MLLTDLNLFLSFQIELIARKNFNNSAVFALCSREIKKQEKTIKLSIQNF